MELRTVDPHILHDNPNNPRRTASPPDADAMLRASISAVGIIHPPLVRTNGDDLVIIAGHRRVRAAIETGTAEIAVILCDHGDSADDMRAVAENIVRAPMSRVDQWRATEKLITLGWNEDGIASALALPVRTVKVNRLLANVLPQMLDQMARGDQPNDAQLRVIALATETEQAQVWKKYRPKKNESADWYSIARGLEKRRIPASAARFDDQLAKAYGITWFEDLFEQAGTDNRFTSNVDAFFGAQQEWLTNNLPARGTLLTMGDYNEPRLPKGAERIWGKPGKHDSTGWYINTRTAEPECIPYRMKQQAPTKKNGKIEADDLPAPKPPLTQKGAAMLGDLRTDALHDALRTAPIESETLLGLLVLALSGENVSVTAANAEAHHGRRSRTEIAAAIIENGGLTVDGLAIMKAAREMLAEVLSCRANASRSGLSAMIAGAVLEADDFLPNLATPEFLACLSRAEVERAARESGLPVKAKLKDTRESLVTHFSNERFLPALARFVGSGHATGLTSADPAQSESTDSEHISDAA